MEIKRKLPSSEEKEKLIEEFKKRFEKHMKRHEGVKWEDIEKKIKDDEELLTTLFMMEISGGEPDVFKAEEKLWYVDFSKETPKERRSICFDEEALNSRKANKPATSAEAMAAEIGVEILDEEEYRLIQKTEELDLKTSSWIKTPDKIRKLGGALFCDRRYDTVFTYHNGAESYYGVRGFRGKREI